MDAEGLYREACALTDGLIFLHDRPEVPIGPEGRQRLERALRLFEQVVRWDPRHWPSLWLQGKIHQRFEAFEEALACFEAAHRIQPDQADVAREASIAAMEAGLPDRAIPFCERAILARPDDAGLSANLALALLFSGRPEEAAKVAEPALRRSPTDEITAQIVSIIREVLDGSRLCPGHVRDL